MIKPLSDKARKPHEWTANDLRNLQVDCKNEDPTVMHIPLKKVLVCPKVFQVRNLQTKSKAGITDPAHVGKLAERLDREAELDPILVLPISANRFVVIDGTHRRAAYDRRQRETIPVKVFQGTLADARVAAGRSDNAKKRLEWTSAEKSQYLYQLVLERLATPSADRMTQKECAAAADRTDRLVKHMEKTIQRYKDEGREVPEMWNGGAWADDDEGRESTEDRMVREFEEKLAALGKLSPAKAQALGIALARYTEHAAAVAKALVFESGQYDEVFDEFSETGQYVRGMFAAVGAGF
jgi:uncharacterized ParB-like nuclease family protein